VVLNPPWDSLGIREVKQKQI